jgi:hypothetical protein
MEARFENEAHRLLSLDARERELEAVAIILRMGEKSQNTADDLHQMDMKFLDLCGGIPSGARGS